MKIKYIKRSFEVSICLRANERVIHIFLSTDHESITLKRVEGVTAVLQNDQSVQNTIIQIFEKLKLKH
ncbi:4025_t:CDS:2 [Funneliformis caledonium]|uniref:4025_t:CDS:1 n=1 Tax=Funneliformis caledonium TaxID=1117310 RepID=A0A9N9BEU2_9GLOM|nr:4025_t:CDS:2 [Funneliformis caledonium]